MTGIPLNGKTVDLAQLQAEMVAASIAVTALGTAGGMLFTYNGQGQPADLPNGAAAVLAAHVPHPDAATVQRAQDAATLLNSAAVRDSQLHRDAFARLINCAVLTIPLNQDATPADIHPYIAT